MAGIGERLIKLRFELGIKQGKFAGRIEMSQGMLSDIERGNRPLTDRNIKLICLEFGVNREWLVDGRGDMFPQKPGQSPSEQPPAPILDDDGKPLEGDEAEIIGIYRQLETPGQDDVRRYADEKLELQQARENKNEKKITVIQTLEKVGDGDYSSSKVDR